MSQRQKGLEKTRRLPLPIRPISFSTPLVKPEWIRVRAPGGEAFERVKQLLRQQQLHTVCEEASCPNIGECFSSGTATFMILGDICTRRCPFCDVASGQPLPPDADEPRRLAESVRQLQLRYVVITSVDRDDLPDGGAMHFVRTLEAIAELAPATKVEILVPDFKKRMAVALDAFALAQPAVFNHNLETVPRLYKKVRPAASYQGSLELLAQFGQRFEVPTKSGLMVGVGESDEEVDQVLHDLRAHGVKMLTIGQYLAPTTHHLAVARYVPLESFEHWRQLAAKLGFDKATIGPLVRSSYHAEDQLGH